LIALAALGWILAAAAVCGAAYCIIATVLFARFLARTPATSADFPGVTILKPLHGAPANLHAALTSFCGQDYPGPFQIILGVQDPADPAIAVVNRLKSEHPDLDIALVIDETLHGANRKISNLINMAPSARWELLVLSDADVEAPSDYLRSVVAELGAPGVGAVTCLYHGRGVKGLFSTLSAMGIDYRFAPSVVLGVELGMAHPCLGPSIALPASLLAAVGGFTAFSDCLADDYEIGRAVRRQGLSIVVPPGLVTHTCGEDSLAAFMDHEIRWARTVRRIDPRGYAGSGITHPLPLVLIAAAALGFSPVAIGLVFAILLVRVGSKFRIDAITRTSAGPWWLVPVSDVLSFVVFLASFLSNTVVWQGRRFRVGPDGILSNI
jgi:ceramide glucosyltransferase